MYLGRFRPDFHPPRRPTLRQRTPLQRQFDCPACLTDHPYGITTARCLHPEGVSAKKPTSLPKNDVGTSAPVFYGPPRRECRQPRHIFDIRPGAAESPKLVPAAFRSRPLTGLVHSILDIDLDRPRRRWSHKCLESGVVKPPAPANVMRLNFPASDTLKQAAWREADIGGR